MAYSGFIAWNGTVGRGYRSGEVADQLSVTTGSACAAVARSGGHAPFQVHQLRLDT